MSCWSCLTGPVPLPGPLGKGEVLAGKGPTVVVLGWPETNTICSFFLDPAAALVYYRADRPPHGDHSLFQQ